MLKLANIIVNMEYERIDLEKKVEKLEKDLTKSENIRKDLVDVNKILTIAVQQAIDSIKSSDDLTTSRYADHVLFTLEKAEAEVKKISIREY